MTSICNSLNRRRIAVAAVIAGVVLAPVSIAAAAEFWLPTAQEARELCDLIADVETRVALLEDHAVFRNFPIERHFRFGEATFDHDNDGTEDTMVSRLEGSAGNLAIGFRDDRSRYVSGPAVLPGGVFYTAADGIPDDHARPSGEDFIEYNGHYYKLDSWDRYFREPAALGIITPDREYRPLCGFSNVSMIEPTPESAVNCRLMLDKERAPRLAIEPLREDDLLLSVYPGAAWSRKTEGAITIDINNDGVEERLLYIGYYIGAGAGCTLAYFDLAHSETRSEEETRQMRSDLLEAQRMEHDPVDVTPGCNFPDAGSREVFAYRGQTLFYSPRSVRRNAAISRIGERYGVEMFCEFVTVFRTEVSEYFLPVGAGSVRGWG